MDDLPPSSGIKGRIAQLQSQGSQSDDPQSTASGTQNRPSVKRKPLPDLPRLVKKSTSNANEETTEQTVFRPEALRTSQTEKDDKAAPPVPARLSRARLSKIHATVDKNNTTKDDCIITVTGFDKHVTEEALKLHFENNKKSGGGLVDSVSITDGTAAVHFKHASDARNVLGKVQIFREKQLTVSMASAPQTLTENMFIVSGFSDTALHVHEMLTDFLESKTGCSVLKVEECQQNGQFLVVFAEDSYPAFADLQAIFKNNKLEGTSLEISPYVHTEDEYTEPIYEEEMSTTTGQMKFIEKYEMENIKKVIGNCNAAFSCDRKEYKLRVKGKDAKNVAKSIQEKVLNNIQESELQLSMPGIQTFVKSPDARVRIASFEEEHGCVIVTQEGTYEIIDGIRDADNTDTESDDSGGSLKGGKKLAESEQQTNGSRSNIMGEVQIVSCRLQMKAGTVDTEDSDCFVNITQSDINKGDIWSRLRGDIQDDITKQGGMPYNLTEWRKSGVITTSVTGLPCKYIIHVSQKHLRWDIVKVVMKCLQIAGSMNLTSVAFFSMKSRGKKISTMEDSPQLLVEAISKYQKSGKSSVTQVRLVQEKMDSTFVSVINDEVEKIQNLRKAGFFSGGFAGFRARLQSRQSLKIVSSSPTSVKSRMSLPGPKKQAENDLQWYEIINADVTVYLYSHSQDTNKTVFEKLDKYCQEKMPPTKIENEKIKYFTKDDIKCLRSKKVEVEVNIDNGWVEMRGYPSDISVVHTKLNNLLDQISVPEKETPSRKGDGEADDAERSLEDDKEVFRSDDFNAAPEKSQTDKPRSSIKDVPDGGRADGDDDDDIFGKFVASQLRDVSDSKRKKKVKVNVTKLLMDVITQED